MRFENSELRAFRAVIEEGGFRRAAEALHLSQSAVSQAVAGLEFKSTPWTCCAANSRPWRTSSS
jgi:hypothetical protein